MSSISISGDLNQYLQSISGQTATAPAGSSDASADSTQQAQQPHRHHHHGGANRRSFRKFKAR